MHRIFRLAAFAFLALTASACTFEREGPPEYHYQEFKTDAPRGNTYTICHAYGCNMQTPVVIGPAEVKLIAAEMKRIAKSNTPGEERRAIAYAVSWMERYVGNKIGTKGDRPGMEFNGPGDPTQQDCVDEATNTTSYLLVLERNGLLKHHKVGRPFSRGNILLGVSNWVHWTATMNENSTGVKWAVDSWIYENGENPAIVEANKWYRKDLKELPKSSI